jgi:hypothetical protein
MIVIALGVGALALAVYGLRHRLGRQPAPAAD